MVSWYRSVRSAEYDIFFPPLGGFWCFHYTTENSRIISAAFRFHITSVRFESPFWIEAEVEYAGHSSGKNPVLENKTGTARRRRLFPNMLEKQDVPYRQL
jgi:hypothetical protein